MALSSSIGVWIGAFLTLCILSFLYKDNPFYKFAEHLFIGISAAYWMVMGFWTTSSAPTQTMRDNHAIVAAELPAVIDELRTLVEVDLAAVEDAVEAQGGPWTPGRMPVFNGGE